MAVIDCPHCGKKNSDRAPACFSCQGDLTAQPPDPEPEPKPETPSTAEQPEQPKTPAAADHVNWYDKPEEERPSWLRARGKQKK